MDGVTKDSVSVRPVILVIIVTISASQDYGEITVAKSVTVDKMLHVSM